MFADGRPKAMRFRPCGHRNFPPGFSWTFSMPPCRVSSLIRSTFIYQPYIHNQGQGGNVTRWLNLNSQSQTCRLAFGKLKQDGKCHPLKKRKGERVSNKLQKLPATARPTDVTAHRSLLSDFHSSIQRSRVVVDKKEKKLQLVSDIAVVFDDIYSSR